MVNQTTYNQIVARFQAFASGHFMLQQFTHGSLQEMIEQLPETGYPLMHVELAAVEYEAGMRSFRFTIIFADIPRDKEVANEYQREAISDMIQIGEDLIAEIRNGGVIFGIEAEIDPNVIFTPFVASYTHTLAGITLDLRISLPYTWTACDIPAEWSVPGSGTYPSGSGGGALLLKVNGTPNAVQSILDLIDGDNIAIEDQGDGKVKISASGGTSAAWGSITGTLSNQTDLQLALDLKADISSLSAVAFSGDYNDLTNLPGAEDLQSTLNAGSSLNQDNSIIGNQANDLQFTNNGRIRTEALDASGAAFFQAKTPSQFVELSSEIKTQSVNSGREIGVRVEGDVSGSGDRIKIITPDIADGNGSLGSLLNLTDAATGEAEWVGLKDLLALQDLSDVDQVNTQDGDVLRWNQSTNQWENNGGLTQAESDISTLQIDVANSIKVGDAAGGDLSGTYPNPNVDRVHGIDFQSGTPSANEVWVYGGSPAKWQHQALTASQIPQLDATKIGAGSVSNAEFAHLDGTTSPIQTQLNGKVDANAAISGATATKITFDSKGLVTAGSSLLASDLPSGIDATKIGSGAVSNAEFGYLDGVTSAIQSQIDALALGAIAARGTAVAAITTGAVTWTSCNLSINLVAGRTYYIEAVWNLQPTFNPTGGGRVGFSWSGSLSVFHGSYQGSASEISMRSGNVNSLGVGSLFPSNTPYLASDIARPALSPTTFKGYCTCDANAILTMGFAAVTGGATISFAPRGSYIKAIRIA